MVVLKKVLFLLVLLQLVNCGSSAVLLTEKPLSNYKVVILSPMAKDEFNIAPHILKRFKELGFRVLVEAPLRVKSLCIKESNTHNLPLFRIHEYELLVLINSHVKDHLSGLKGVVLSPAQGWNDRHRF